MNFFKSFQSNIHLYVKIRSSFQLGGAILKCRAGRRNDSEDDLDTPPDELCLSMQYFKLYSSASLVMHLTFVSWRSNFVLDGWMDGHPRVQHSNNNKLNNYQQNCFNPSRNLSGSRLNFTSLIRKGKVSPGLYLSTSTQLD